MDVLSSLLGGESLLDIFSKTINGWFGNLVTSAFEKFDELMVGLLTGVFHFEDLIATGATTVLTKESIRSVYIFIYLLIVSLIVLKFMFKGFQIYILWRDGDADASPRDMLVGAIESGAVTVCFPYLYEKAANVFIYIAEGIMRITALRSPLVDEDVAVSASIRKVDMTAVVREKLVGTTLTEQMMTFLELCLTHGVSIAFSGETGAGKTSLAGCLLNYAAKSQRIYTIEEGSREWDFVQRDEDGKVTNSVIHTRTRLNEKDSTQNFGQEELVKFALRFNPDIIAPGEIRGRESFEVMGVSNTGHTVITTTHSNGTLDTPERIVGLAKKAYDMTDTTLFAMCARAFPILVHMEQNADRKRRVTEIREVTGCVHGEIQSHLLFNFDVEDNIYDGDTCVRTDGTFRQLEPISQELAKRMLKKGARRSELQQFLEVEHEIFQWKLSHGAFCVCLCLLQQAGNNKKAFPSIRSIAKLLEMGCSTVCRALGAIRKLHEMERLFKYHGTVSSISFSSKGCCAADLILGDITDRDKPPVRVEAHGALAKYMNEIEMIRRGALYPF